MIIDLLLSMRVTCLWPPSEYEGHGGDSPRGLEWLISPAWPPVSSESSLTNTTQVNTSRLRALIWVTSTDIIIHIHVYHSLLVRVWHISHFYGCDSLLRIWFTSTDMTHFLRILLTFWLHILWIHITAVTEIICYYRYYLYEPISLPT